MSGGLSRFLLRPAPEEPEAACVDPAPRGPIAPAPRAAEPAGARRHRAGRRARAGTRQRPGRPARGASAPEAAGPPPLVVALGGGDGGTLAARAVAQVLRRQHRAAAVLVCRWTGAAQAPDPASGPDAPDAASGRPSAPAVPAAVRLAALARDAGLDAAARGRLVEVALEATESAAVAQVERAEALGAPCVVHLAGPWGVRALPLLGRADDVVAHGTDAALAACRDTLARHHVRPRSVRPPRSPLARARLRAGWPAAGTALGEDGQAGVALLLLLAMLGAVAAGLGLVASAGAAREEDQRAVDLAALAGAADLREGWGGTASAGRGTAALVARARRAAEGAARANGLPGARVDFPDRGAAGDPPLRVRVRGGGPRRIAGVAFAGRVAATAEMAPAAPPLDLSGDAYDGPLATRLGQRMRPDVALAFDRLEAAARRAGHRLTITSGFRSDAEQAALFAARPDPKWVARPGTSLHRMGTELDLGPPSAYGWLAAHAEEHGFEKRYSWEPWHFGFTREARSTPNDVRRGDRGALQSWVPARYAPAIRRAAVRWKVSAALLAAQLKAESNFDPSARSPVGAAGIAQFMPATAAAYGLRDPRRVLESVLEIKRLLISYFPNGRPSSSSFSPMPSRTWHVGARVTATPARMRERRRAGPWARPKSGKSCRERRSRRRGRLVDGAGSILRGTLAPAAHVDRRAGGQLVPDEPAWCCSQRRGTPAPLAAVARRTGGGCPCSPWADRPAGCSGVSEGAHAATCWVERMPSPGATDPEAGTARCRRSP